MKVEKQQARFLAKKLKEYVRQDKRWRALARIVMLMEPGSMLCPAQDDPDLGFLLENGHQINPRAVVKKAGSHNRCHDNTCFLYLQGKADAIGTGYALSDDGVWRQHSWAMRGSTILETTEKRIRYWGVILEGRWADFFCRRQLGY